MEVKILNSMQLKTVGRISKYIGVMRESVGDLNKDCSNVAGNKPKGSEAYKLACDIVADLSAVDFLFEKTIGYLNSIISKTKEKENENTEDSN